MRHKPLVFIAILGIVAIVLIACGEAAAVLTPAAAQAIEAPAAAFAPAAATEALPAAAPEEVSFEQRVIDSNMAGDCKMVGDIDGDGFPDLVIGGKPDENLKWYHYPDWSETQIAVPNKEFTTDGELGDVDGDGDLDIVVPDGPENDNLKWFENPLLGGNPFNGSAWTRHSVGSIGDWGKDVELADLDGDGRLDIATRSHTSVMIFFQTFPNNWSKKVFGGLSIGSEGMASGDIDKDGDVDLVLKGTWLRNPGGTSARTPSNWSEYTIGSADSTFKALVVDLNQDGKMDVLFSSSEGTADVRWWTPSTNDPTGSWTSHTIAASVNRSHTLQAADMDNDGDIDVVVAQMHTSTEKEVMVYHNLNGEATSWQKQVVATTGLHNGVVADIGNDGDYDIFGANWTGNPPVHLWENQLNPSLDKWTYIRVDDSRSGRAFGLAMGDLTGDGYGDIVSGRYFYRNPDGDMTGVWTRVTFSIEEVDAMLIVDVDGDGKADVIGEALPDIYWLEAQDVPGNSWNSTKIGTMPKTSHENGQGYVLAQVIPGGRPEILLAGGNGIYHFEIPSNPEAGNWPRTQITDEATDEGIGVGDIDGDGDIDIAAGVTGGDKIAWWENPGDGTGDWTKYKVGTTGDWPDRLAVADINGDGRLDIIMSEETPLEDASVYWFEQPTDPKSPGWTRHTVVTQYTTNSLDVADMDKDGDIDLITGEHRGTEKVAIWQNVNNGSSWVEHVVSEGRESHLGARVADLDGDGDLEIVSIAWDDYPYLHLWRNDALVGGTFTVATPTITPNGGTFTGPVSVTLATSTSSASIYYTTDGSEPITTSTLYSGAFMLTNSATVKARAFRSGYNPSNVASASFIINTTGLRVIDGQQVLYTFKEGSGTTVYDVSGIGTPLNLGIENGTAASWLPGRGLVINSSTIVSSVSAATKVINASQDTNEITIEAWIKPASVTQDGPARIVTLSLDPFNRNFTLGQGGNIYDTRLRTTATSDSGIPSLSTSAGSASAQLSYVVYTRDASGVSKIYVNGVEQASGTIGGDFSNWDGNFRLALANELTGDRPWLGEFHLVAIFNRALSQAEVSQNFNAGLTTITP